MSERDRQLPMGDKLSRPTDNVASRKSQVQNNRKRKSKSSQAVEVEVEMDQELDYVLEQAARREIVEIIQIRLANCLMENDNNATEEKIVRLQHQLAIAEGALTSDTLNANEQIVNVTVGVGGGMGMEMAAAGSEAVSGAIRTAGSSTEAPKTNTNERQLVVNNNNLPGSVASASAAVKTLQLHDVEVDVGVDVDADESEIATTSLLRRRRSSSVEAEGVEYCEVLEPTTTVNEMLSSGAQRTQGKSEKEKES